MDACSCTALHSWCMLPAGSLKQRGLVFPLTADVYQPILTELRERSKDWATWMEAVETLA